MNRDILHLLLLGVLAVGCAHVKAEHWDSETGNKVAEYSGFGVFRNDITVNVSKEQAVKLGVNRPGLSDNGLEAIKVAPALANEIGHTMTASQALESLSDGVVAKARASTLDIANEEQLVERLAEESP